MDEEEGGKNEELIMEDQQNLKTGLKLWVPQRKRGKGPPARGVASGSISQGWK